uniref:Uncharacterized protein n=1 Tax=Neobodo designis TaxID=312471 RepID=A0A7S1M4U1_NEODS|mmetsp:Transcript_34194/g.105653  ORF Transcript_34194/g.105653 Transcript_34194/m.105653 type:complete len:238 (+) Transcript_34194:212-925(+)|eukprot:CAMPEP_0174828210 /NCGR_PEP_ID=MMETSP1114-20130205/1197_1 /TAXON_ID=312471 /ORGANISM="Neobodo designis, Strain CCAP 1951/1" /LENGTH=237 /DNA_ID=CAMNT_0016061921 /DNA_START=212 /DNA_END=925 /DNA_ORIENTATION=-
MSDVKPEKIPHVKEDCPVLCTHCSKLPGEIGIPVRRGVYRPWCTHCGVSSACEVVDGVAKCKMVPSHTAVMTHMCVDCDATHKKDQVVVPQNAVPYSRTFAAGTGTMQCSRNGPGCTPHLFEAADCPHVLCSACLLRGLPMVLSAINSSDPLSKPKAARRFQTDDEDFIVPPCPVCYFLGATGENGTTCGNFALQTTRALPPVWFNSLKALANVAFHQRQRDEPDSDPDDRDRIRAD